MDFRKSKSKLVKMQNTINISATCEADTKVCTTCEQEKSIIEFEQYKTKRGGFSNRCLFCERGKTRSEIEANRKKFAENREKRAWARHTLWPKQKWTCKVCMHEKLWTDFKPDVKYPDQPSWCCKACQNSPEAHKVADERSDKWCRANFPYYK
jgi:hypothetical protein